MTIQETSITVVSIDWWSLYRGACFSVTDVDNESAYRGLYKKLGSPSMRVVFKTGFTVGILGIRYSTQLSL